MNERLDITIRFYEELNFFLKKHPKKQNIQFTYYGKRSVKDLIESFGVPHVEVDLILVNSKSVDFSYILNNGDRISVYPVFERFNIGKISLLRDQPLRENKFILDVHLGKLAKHLRLLGFDTDYKAFRDDRTLAKISSDEHRILLTRDRQLLMRKMVQWGLIIRSDDSKEQILEVLDRIDLRNDIHPFTRCLSCNGIIKSLTIDSAEFELLRTSIPPKVLNWCSEFNYCPSCKKVYWKGSHYESLMRRIEGLKKNTNL